MEASMRFRGFVIMILMSGFSLFGQSIAVTSPNGGEAWIKGTVHHVTWTTTSITEGTFQVTLWKDGVNQGVVATGLPHTQHSFSWTVGSLANGSDAAIGTGYTIKVRLQNQQPNGFSNGTFKIVSSPPAVAIIKDMVKVEKKPGFYKYWLNRIRISEPLEGSQHAVGKPIDVKWENDFGNGDYSAVNLSFVHIDGVKIAGHSTPNSGTYSWTPQSLYNHKDVYVEIKTEDGKFCGRSGNFKLFLQGQLK